MISHELLPSRALSDPFTVLRRDLDVLFENLCRVNGGPDADTRLAMFPPVDVSEDAECLRVTADVPGFEREDVTVVVEDRRLVLTGSRAEEREEKGSNWHRRERATGEFRREIEISADVDASIASATLRNGVLTVELPKKAEILQRRRVVEVQA